MNRSASLTNALPSLFESTPAHLGVRALGVLSTDTDGRAILTCGAADGVTSVRLRKDLQGRISPFDTLIRVAELSDRTSTAPGSVLSLLIPGAADDTSLLVFTGGATPADGDQSAVFDHVVDRAASVLKAGEPSDGELLRLRWDAAIDSRLPALVREPGVRELAAAISRVCRDVMPVSEISLELAGQAGVDAITYNCRTGEPVAEKARTASAVPFTFELDGLLYQLSRDDRTVRIPLRIDSAVVGTLAFASVEGADALTPDDAARAARIGEFVSLALTHQRLRSEAQAVHSLKARENGLVVLDGILSMIRDVLDVREVFDRIFELSQSAMPHDAMAIAVATKEQTHIKLYATTGAVRHLPVGLEIRMPDHTLVEKEWEYELIDNMIEDPRYVNTNSAKAGMRSLIMIPVRLENQVRGWVNFFSREPYRFTPDDVAVARRIAAHIVLALSHQRLAEQARQNEELRAKATSLELLDELLTALSDSGDIPSQFGRISSIAAKVLPHDGLILMVRLPPDGARARLYAVSGVDVPQPFTSDVPPELLKNPDWEFHIFDDVSVFDDPRYQAIAQRGFRGMLRVPIRLDGQFAGALIFLAKDVSSFSLEHVPVAKRLSERLAIPLAHDREVEALKKADEATARAVQLEARVKELTDELDSRTGYRRVVGESKKWRQVLTQATQVAATDTTVLLLGESGTGKEVVARFLHRGSSRKAGPFIALNCAALPEQLLEAELFGYERGAYTGATQSKPGQLEQASGGTLFLDEVGEMSPSAQAKFLRVLQEREFQRLGGTRVLRTDARIVAATNRDLQKGIANGQFREDLYYRLNVFAILLPPLRDRHDDVLPLSEAFITEIGKGLGRPPAGISREARKLLVEYHWPGNVRELRNILERAAILCDGGLITTEHLSLPVLTAPPTPVAPVAPHIDSPPQESQPAAPPPASMRPSSAGDLQAMERQMIEQALQTARFNKSKAAKALGLTRHQLYIRMKKYGFE
jgi:transcriptional regulator with GAF, ATPase, and Fis domain